MIALQAAALASSLMQVLIDARIGSVRAPRDELHDPVAMAGTFAQFLRNLRARDLPLGRRLAITARSYSLRVIRRRACCGHLGEPGY